LNFHEYPDREALFLDLSNMLAGELRRALSEEDRATFSVPGGTTPGPVFDNLSGVGLDWGRVDVLLNDERWVPESSERSNTALVRGRLLTGRAAEARMIPLHREGAEPEEALDALAEAVEPALPIDVLLLGMGTDCHIASIFPGADRLDEALSARAPVLLPMRAPGVPEARITLSMRVLREAMSTHILITGAEKRAALEAARGADPAEKPVAAILNTAHVHWAE